MQAMRSLGRMRAEKTGDARAWTPIEMLEDLIREAKAGDIDLTEAIIIFNKNDVDVDIRRAGVDVATEFLMIRDAMKRVAGLD